MNEHEDARQYELDGSSFKLPFMNDLYPSNEDDENTEWDHGTVFQNMEETVPSEAIFIGQVDSEVDGMAVTWKLESHYYCIPWAGEDFDWALFAINWDDNWSRYEWESLMRIKGEKEHAVAAKAMFTHLLSTWGYDRENSGYEAFYELLDQI